MRSIVPLFAFPLVVAVPALAVETIPVPAFQGVELRGGGEVVVRPGPVQRVTILEGSRQFTEIRVHRGRTLRINMCNARCPQRYRLRVEVQSPRLPDVAVNGGGAIRSGNGFRGQSRVAAAVNGGGLVDLRSVEVGSATTAVNGGGQISIRARDMLSAAVNGGGEVRYWGAPRVSSAIHGGGMVRPGN